MSEIHNSTLGVEKQFGETQRGFCTVRIGVLPDEVNWQVAYHSTAVNTSLAVAGRKLEKRKTRMESSGRRYSVVETDQGALERKLAVRCRQGGQVAFWEFGENLSLNVSKKTSILKMVEERGGSGETGGPRTTTYLYLEQGLGVTLLSFDFYAGPGQVPEVNYVGYSQGEGGELVLDDFNHNVTEAVPDEVLEKAGFPRRLSQAEAFALVEKLADLDNLEAVTLVGK